MGTLLLCTFYIFVYLYQDKLSTNMMIALKYNLSLSSNLESVNNIVLFSIEEII